MPSAALEELVITFTDETDEKPCQNTWRKECPRVAVWTVVWQHLMASCGRGDTFQRNYCEPCLQILLAHAYATCMECDRPMRLIDYYRIRKV